MRLRSSDPPPPSVPEDTAATALQALFSEAIKGGDAYAAVFRALRKDGDDLRVGNLFTRNDRVKGVAFVAVGNAAVPMATALLRGLGDSVTQGLVIGPEAPPDNFPFQYRKVTDPALPSVEGAKAAEEALELASGLHAGELFVPLISPGALGMLALPPAGMDLDAYRSLLADVAQADLDLESNLSVPRALSRTQGGRLGAAAGEATVEALIVEGGDGGAQVGAGPTTDPPPTLFALARTTLEGLGWWDRLSPQVQRSLTEETTLHGRPRGARHSVVVAGPADALDGAGVESATRRHKPKLVDLHDTRPPEEAAAHLLEALDYEIGRPRDSKSRGVAVFSGVTLGTHEGQESTARMEVFAAAAKRHLKRRDVMVGVFYTGGSIRAATQKPLVFATALEGPTSREMKGGFTDVGTLALAWYDAAEGGST